MPGPSPGPTAGWTDRAAEGFPVPDATATATPPRSLTIWLALLLALATILPLAGLAGRRPGRRRRHAEIRPRITGIKPLTKEVYGYLPYWRLDSGPWTGSTTTSSRRSPSSGSASRRTATIDTALGRLQGVRRRRRRGGHQRGPRQGRPGRPDVPAVRLGGALHEDDRVPRELRRPDRFIAQALDLMADAQGGRREPRLRADGRLSTTPGATCRSSRGSATAMKARFPSATLVNATSAGAGEALIRGLVPLVDQQMIMTYGYRTGDRDDRRARSPRSTTPTRNVKHPHHADPPVGAGEVDPPRRAVLRLRLAGRRRNVPNADRPVEQDDLRRGQERHATPRARDFLAAHPRIVRQYDAARGQRVLHLLVTPSRRPSGRSTSRTNAASPRSTTTPSSTGLGGIGIWTLDNDRGYGQLWSVLRRKFYAPVHAVTITGSICPPASHRRRRLG